MRDRVTAKAALRALGAALALLAGLSGCQLRWEVTTDALPWEPTEGRAWVSEWTEADGCSETVLNAAELHAGVAPLSLDLPAGRYCLTVEAWDEACSVARGTTGGVQLPATGLVSTALEETAVDGSPVLEGACRGAVPRWPANGAFLRAASASFRVAIPARAAAHVPRPDFVAIVAWGCEAEVECLRPEAGVPPEAGMSAPLFVEEGVTEWSIPLSGIEGLSSWRRIAWRARAFYGARWVDSEPRYFHVGRSPRDLDGDGADDLVVGQPGGGRLFLYRSANARGFVETLEGCGDPDGASVPFAWPGDLDGSGTTSLVASCAAGGAPAALAAYRVSEAGGLRAFPLDGAGDDRVRALAVAGDLDGDGRDDLLVESAAGISVRWGPGEETASVALPTDGALALAGGSDLDGDGFADFAIADPRAVWVCRGGPSRPPAFTLEGGCAPVELGAEGPLVRSVHLAQDANGDFRGELLVHLAGAPDDVVALFASGAEGAPPTPRNTLALEGAASLAVGDVNQDGLADLVVGLPDALEGAGRVEIRLGSRSDLALSGAPIGFDRLVPILADRGDGAWAFGRAVGVVDGRLGGSSFDLAVTGLERRAGEPRVPQVHLYAFDERTGPEPALSLSPPLADLASYGDTL